MSLWHGTGSLVLGYVLVLLAALATLARRRASIRGFVLAPLAAVVALIAAGALGGALAAAVEHLLGHAASPWLATPVILLALLAAGFLSGWHLSRTAPGAGISRGTLIREAPRTNREGTPGESLQIAGVAIPQLDETKHFKLIGTTGTGKSTAIRELMEGALARGDRAIFADPDGGYLARFYDPHRGDVVLNPFDPRSVKWDLFQELRALYDFDQLARSLIGEGTGSEKSWRGYAQLFFSALVRQLHEAGIKDTGELYRLLTAAPVEELRILLEGTPARPFLEEGNERMFGSIRAVTASATVALDYLRTQSATPFSIRQWVGEGRGVLFLPYRADQIAALRSVISTWMRIAIFELMSQGEADHKLWFVVDELDALGAIDGLKDALARLRKFGGRVVLGCQSIAQVSGLYGESESQSIVENCANTLILRCSASEQGGTARFASRLIGEREIVRTQVTRNHATTVFGASRGTESHSLQHVVESAVLPSEIEQLPDLTGYLRLASRPEWMFVQLPRS